MRSIKSRHYRQHLDERFSLNISRLKEVDIIIHAVSLGEAKAITPLVQALKNKNQSIMVTMTTPTGRQEIARSLGNDVLYAYLPIDSPLCIKPWLKKLNPKKIILVEKEVWPNLIHFGNKMGSKVILANAMLSERSTNRLKRFWTLLEPTYLKLSMILSQSEEVSQRFQQFGIKNVKTVGNLKFDIALDETATHKAKAISHLFNNRDVFMAASTHPSEEEKVIAAYQSLKSTMPNLLLVLAPRHPERFRSIEKLLQEKNLAYQCTKPELLALDKSIDVILINELGVLLQYFLLAKVAFVAGSFVSVGGHNPLEPILTNTLVISGPLFANWQDIYQRLIEVNGVQIVENDKALANSIKILFNDKTLSEKQKLAASQVLKTNQGALLRHLSEISQL